MPKLHSYLATVYGLRGRSPDSVLAAIRVWRRFPLDCFFIRRFWQLFFENDKRVELWLTNPECLVRVEPIGLSLSLAKPSKFQVEFTGRISNSTLSRHLATLRGFSEDFRVFVFGSLGTIPCFTTLQLKDDESVLLSISASKLEKVHARLEESLGIELERRGIDSLPLHQACDFVRQHFVNGDIRASLPRALRMIPDVLSVDGERIAEVNKADVTLRKLRSQIVAGRINSLKDDLNDVLDMLPEEVPLQPSKSTSESDLAKKEDIPLPSQESVSGLPPNGARDRLFRFWSERLGWKPAKIRDTYNQLSEDQRKVFGDGEKIDNRTNRDGRGLIYDGIASDKAKFPTVDFGRHTIS
jgi:hypothetical protein